MPGFFKERHIDHGGGVAHGAGITIPIPGSREVATFLYDANIRDALFNKSGTGHEARETTPDKRKRHVVTFGFPFNKRCVWISEVMVELILDLDVLLIAVRAKSLVAFLAVALLDHFFINGGFRHRSNSIEHKNEQ